MPQAATLLLMFAGEPTRSERALIDAHAKKRDSAYIAPAPTPPARYPAYSGERVRALEGRLDEARTLSSSLDEPRALEVLDAVEHELHEHPELPQAAFLLAERHRLAAAIHRSEAGPDGEAHAFELEARSFALEGTRATAFGETPLPPHVEAAFRRVHVVFTDADARDEIEIDGVSGSARRELLLGGEHHVRVLRGDALVFAGFLEREPPASIRLGIPPVASCSAWDLAAVSANTKVPTSTASVRCGRWVAVRRMLGKLELAECEQSRCGAFFALEPPPPPPKARFPQWASVAIAGAASIGATSLVLWAAGAFDRPVQPVRTDVVYRGN